MRLGGNRQRILLTMLLLQANHAVAADRLVRAIWGDAPPATARSQIRICVSGLRRQFAAAGVRASIETHRQGYLIRVAPGDVDLHHFETLVAEARTGACGAPSEAVVQKFREALQLWRGPIGAGMESELLDSVALKFHEDRYSAMEDRFEFELQIGEHRRVLGELTHLVAEHPFRETLCAQLMIALFRSGRTAEALSLFRLTRRRFSEELGIEPGERLRRIERRILTGEGDEASLGSTPPCGPPPQTPGCPDPAAAAGPLSPQDRIALLEQEIAVLREEYVGPGRPGA
ncbi:AfsR/SARP family transcriptional regulator [Streptomyces sp. PR69]|uniref:AfsR/SARP family transcriptional regulator n=1 Tax=Streptomyces sp. PR69 TaxID=2984950 RepID=UPI002264C067|nr:AfsR/SARP family transcriptional regulator [Streptomyces sp. PR69]